MGTVSLMRLEGSCCPLSQPTMPRYVTPGLRRGRFISRPGNTRNRHCIDYVIMKNMHRRCLHVCVMRGEYCGTDHRMLRVKVVVGKKKLFRRAYAKERDARRWDLTKLKGRCFDETTRETAMGSYVRIEEEIQEECSGVQEKWDTLKTALCEDGA